MTITKDAVYLKNAEIRSSKQEPHIPSKVQADTLFTFTTQVEFLITSIKNRMISPRYCEENLKYLNISGIERIAFPMKCFCDINMHKLNDHLSWYGYYGLAFSKEWGMKRRIQPIQYMNPNSYLCKDFSEAFSAALSEKTGNPSGAVKKVKNALLHQLMYYKPYSGPFTNRNTKQVESKCFTDECEWRFVPDVTPLGYAQAYFDEQILNSGGLLKYSNSMEGRKEISLEFQYSDLKYIIVKTHEDFADLMNAIDSLKLEKNTERELVSKIIIWDNAKGDF